MPAAYVIPLDADDTALDRVIDRTADKIDRLADKASNVSIGGSSRMGGTGGGRGGLSSGDPWALRDQSGANLQMARMMGAGDGEIKPLLLDYAKKDRAADRADRLINGQNGGVWSRLGFGANGFSMRAGLSQILTPELMGLAGLGFAGYQTFKAGNASMQDLGSAYHIGGGTVGETAGVSSVGRFLGRSASESAGAAVAFGDSLHNPTFGAGYLRSRGIVDFGGLTVDKDKNYLKALRAISDEPNRDMATRVARDVGLSDELWLRDLGPGSRETVFGGMNDRLSDADRRERAETKLREAEISSHIDNAYRWSVGAIQRNLDPTSASANAGAIDDYERATRKTPAQIEEWYKKHPEDRPKGTSAASVAPPSVRTQPGQSGGGRRVQQAIPLKMRGQQLSENLQSAGQYIGGYQI